MRESLARIEAKLERTPPDGRSSILWWFAIHVLASHYGMTSRGNEVIFMTFYFSGLLSLVAAIGIVTHSRQQWMLALTAFLGPLVVLHPEVIAVSDIWFWVVVLCGAGVGAISVTRAYGKLRRRFVTAMGAGNKAEQEPLIRPVAPRISDLMILTVILAVSFSMIGQSFRPDALLRIVLASVFGVGMGVTWLGYAIWFIPTDESLGPNRFGTVVCLLPTLVYAILWSLTGGIVIEEGIQMIAVIHASCYFTVMVQKRAGYQWRS